MAISGNIRNALYKFIDIGVNLTDPMFRGIYHNSAKHQDDFSDVITRAKDNGLVKMIITGGCLSDCKEALKLAKSDGEKPSTCTSHHFKGEEVIELIKELDMSKDYPSSTNFKLIMS